LVSYDGTDFCGWQTQPNGRTVQSELNSAVYSVCGERAVVVASGRTDSGVHALAQVCHMDIQKPINPAKLADALNFYLPPDVSVLKSAAAPEGFDASRSAKKKTYRYSLYCSERRNPLKERYALRITPMPDISKLKEGAALFVGEHDFAAYCAAGSTAKTTVRTVYSVEVERHGEDIDIYVCGSGFLYNMVRTIVGTLVDYARGRLSWEQIISSLNSGERRLAGKTLPPQGLTLVGVEYSFNLF